MHATIAVAVGHVEIASGTHSNIRGAVEGTGAPRDRHQILAIIAGVRGRIHHAKGHKQLALGRELPDGVVAIIRAENRTVRAHGDTVRAVGELTLTPRAQEIALLVVYYDGMIPTSDEVHTVLAIYCHPCYVPMRVALGQLFPSLNDSIVDDA